VPACPHDALSISKTGLQVHWDRCELAGKCVEVCLPGALEVTGRPESVGHLLSLLEDDRIYFDESQGGVTFSGGEPFSQPDFLRELLVECRARDLDVVLDTCGHVAPETFRELAPLATRLLFDLKLVDEDRHEAFTGVHNRWILENLKWAASAAQEGRGPALLVRLPLIPGINDDQENLGATARFLGGLVASPPVDVLPYHRLGVDKYQRLGRVYELPGVEPPTNGTVQTAVSILKGEGLRVTVRGEQYGDD